MASLDHIVLKLIIHDDVILFKRFSHYWLLARESVSMAGGSPLHWAGNAELWCVVSRNKLLENSRYTGDLRPLNAHETPLQCSIDICMIYTWVLPPTNSHFTTANSNALHAGYSHSGSLFAFKWLYNEYEHSWLVVVFRPSDNHY